MRKGLDLVVSSRDEYVQDYERNGGDEKAKKGSSGGARWTPIDGVCHAVINFGKGFVGRKQRCFMGEGQRSDDSWRYVDEGRVILCQIKALNSRPQISKGFIDELLKTIPFPRRSIHIC